MPLILLKFSAKDTKLLSDRATSMGYTLEEYAKHVVLDSVTPQTVTMKDVAHRAKVSLMTASFALNHVDGQVSQDTKKRVWKAAKEIGYRPNLTARGLRKQRGEGKRWVRRTNT